MVPHVHRKRFLKLLVIIQHFFFSRSAVYEIKGNLLFYWSWLVFDVAGKQLGDITVRLREWKSVYTGIYKSFTLRTLCVWRGGGVPVA